MFKKLRKSEFFSSFFLPMDPDPDSDSLSGSTQVIESGYNLDPDPQPWLEALIFFWLKQKRNQLLSFFIF
jgi:hypothetical protein